MTLLTAAFAAITCTIIWYSSSRARKLRIGTLCLMYWGASLMWLIDAVFFFFSIHKALIAPSPVDMLNDLYLGLSVVALGLIIWLVILLVKDPEGVVRASLLRKKN